MYSRVPNSGPSRASASTTCQKCLKKGHYSYECKAVVQERPYVSRPSRTQQLMNPKLVPKLTSDVPQDLLRKKGIADEQLAKMELERGRKRERDSEDIEGGSAKRRRSSSSVSTISTNISRSRSPPARSEQPGDTRATETPQLSSPRPKALLNIGAESERKRRRDSFSSSASYTSDGGSDYGNGLKDRSNSRSTRRRLRDHSPQPRGRRTESNKSPQTRLESSLDCRPAIRGHKAQPGNGNGIPRERSLSPFSRRLALTKAMNMER